MAWPSSVASWAFFSARNCSALRARSSLTPPIMAFGGAAEVLKLVEAERPMLAIDEDEIEVELPQNVDHPWGWEGKVVAVRFASGTHGGFDSVGLLHCMSSCVRRLQSDRPILSVFGPLE